MPQRFCCEGSKLGNDLTTQGKMRNKGKETKYQFKRRADLLQLQVCAYLTTSNKRPSGAFSDKGKTLSRKKMFKYSNVGH